MPRRVEDFCVSARRGMAGGERYGIEVEAEGIDFEQAVSLEWPAPMRRSWVIERDGSLRRGTEFISIPLPRSSVPDAVNALWGAVFDTRLAHASVRTGIHIHVNCIHMNTAQVLRMLQHYALVEPVLFAAVGEEREQNIYCIPWYRSLQEPKRVFAWLGDDPERDADMLMQFDEEPPTCKYSALNVSPLSSKGTVEFRHAQTFSTATEMLRWWDIVAAVYHTWDTEYDVFEQWQADGPIGFVERVFRNVTIPTVRPGLFEELDVETVAECLGPSRLEVAPGWGATPTLNVPGEVAMDLAGYAATLRARNARVPIPRFSLADAMAPPPEPYEPEWHDDDDPDEEDFFDEDDQQELTVNFNEEGAA